MNPHPLLQGNYSPRWDDEQWERSYGFFLMSFSAFQVRIELHKQESLCQLSLSKRLKSFSSSCLLRK